MSEKTKTAFGLAAGFLGDVEEGLAEFSEVVCASIVHLRSATRWRERADDALEINAAEYQIKEAIDKIEDGTSRLLRKLENLPCAVAHQIAEISKAYREEAQAAQQSNVHRLNDPEVRQQVWGLTEGRCTYCDVALDADRGAGGPLAFCVEHVVPRSSGGPDNIANYVPACMSCNSSKNTSHVLKFIQRKMRPTMPERVA